MRILNSSNAQGGGDGWSFKLMLQGITKITGRPRSVSGGRCWLKSEQQSFVIYRRNTYEQYGGYNLFQNAEFKANFSIKVWRKC